MNELVDIIFNISYCARSGGRAGKTRRFIRVRRLAAGRELGADCSSLRWRLVSNSNFSFLKNQLKFFNLNSVGATGERKLKVRLGEFDVGSMSETLPYQEQDVGSVVLHPGFDNRSLSHDIALLHLASPAQHKPNVDIVCLPRRDQDSTTGFRRCVITGWGRRNEGRFTINWSVLTGM